MKIVETNCQTGEVIVRDMTKDELASNKAIMKAAADERAEAEAKANAKADLLAKLGISAEEAKLLLS